MSRLNTVFVTLLTAAALMGVETGPVMGQEAGSDVLQATMDAHAERLAGIDSVTIIQDVETPMGMTERQESHLEVIMREGHRTLVPKDDPKEGVGRVSMAAMVESLMNRAKLRGREDIRGHEVYVVAIPDLRMEDMEWVQMEAEKAEKAFRPDSAVLYLDTDTYVLRRGTLEGRMGMQDESRPVTIRMDQHDFRSQEGYLHPHRTETRFNLELGEEMQAMIEKMKQAGMDPAKRMGMAAMMAEGMTTTTTVHEIQVHGG